MVNEPLIHIPDWAQAIVAITSQVIIILGLSGWVGVKIAKYIPGGKRNAAQ